MHPLYGVCQKLPQGCIVVMNTGDGMWICPKCGREFKRINQGHYCGKAPESVDEYISLQEEKARPHLRLLRNIILGSASGIKEKIVWSMPTYSLSGHSLSFAACKEHVSLYIGSEILRIYEKLVTYLLHY